MPGTTNIHKEIITVEFEPGGIVIITTHNGHFQDEVNSKLTSMYCDDVALRGINIFNCPNRKAGSNVSTFMMEFPREYSDNQVKLLFYTIVGDEDNFYKAAAEENINIHNTIRFKTQDRNWLNHAAVQILQLSVFEKNLSEIKLRQSSQPDTYVVTFPEIIADQKEFWLYIINAQYQKAFEELGTHCVQKDTDLLPYNLSTNSNLFQQASLDYEKIKDRFEMVMSSKMPTSQKIHVLLQTLYLFSTTKHLAFAIKTVADLLCKPNNIQCLYAVLNAQLPSNDTLYKLLETLKIWLSKYRSIIDWHIDSSKSQEIQFWTYTNASSLIQYLNNKIAHFNDQKYQAFDGTKIESLGDGHFHRVLFPEHVPDNEKLFWFNSLINSLDDFYPAAHANENNEKTNQSNKPSQQRFNQSTINLYADNTIKFKPETSHWYHYALRRIITLSSMNYSLSNIAVKLGSDLNACIIYFPKEIAKEKEFWFYIINEQYKTAFEILAINYMQENNLIPTTKNFPLSEDFTTVLNYFIHATSFDDMQARLEAMMSSPIASNTKLWHLLHALYHFSATHSPHFDILMNAAIEHLRKPNNIDIVYLLLDTQLSTHNPFIDIHDHLKQAFSMYYAIIDWHVDYSKRREIQFWTYANACSLVSHWEMRAKDLKMNMTIESNENGRFHRFKFQKDIANKEKLQCFHYIINTSQLEKPAFIEDNNQNNNNNNTIYNDDDSIVQNAIANFRAHNNPFFTRKRGISEENYNPKRPRTNSPQQNFFTHTVSPEIQITTEENTMRNTIAEQTPVTSTVEGNEAFLPEPFDYDSLLEQENPYYQGELDPSQWDDDTTSSPSKKH